MLGAGNGDSEGDFVDAVPTKEAEDLGAVLDALGNRRICFAGHSMGGMDHSGHDMGGMDHSQHAGHTMKATLRGDAGHGHGEHR